MKLDASAYHIKQLVGFAQCFLTKHDLTIYPGYSPQLVCKRCQRPYSDTLRDLWRRMGQRAKVRRGDDELPF